MVAETEPAARDGAYLFTLCMQSGIGIQCLISSDDHCCGLFGLFDCTLVWVSSVMHVHHELSAPTKFYR